MRVRHSDTQAGFGMRAKSICRHLKIAYYLDEGLTATSGALRVIPGSHRAGSAYADGLESSMAELQADGRGPDVPAMTLPTRPGDIVCFGSEQSIRSQFPTWPKCFEWWGAAGQTTG